MKIFSIVFFALMVFFINGCTTEPRQAVDPNKYLFTDLESVDAINNWNMDGWVEVDERSLIVNTSPKQSYLLILTRPNYSLNHSVGIAISTTAGSVRSRFDAITTLDKPQIRYNIERIYKLDKAQVQPVKARILGK